MLTQITKVRFQLTQHQETPKTKPSKGTFPFPAAHAANSLSLENDQSFLLCQHPLLRIGRIRLVCFAFGKMEAAILKEQWIEDFMNASTRPSAWRALVLVLVVELLPSEEVVAMEGGRPGGILIRLAQVPRVVGLAVPIPSYFPSFVNSLIA